MRAQTLRRPGPNNNHVPLTHTHTLPLGIPPPTPPDPEGPGLLSELVQNADDAGASTVRVLYSSRHYGTTALLGGKMASWQGPALYFYNDAVFSHQDFMNIARIGQASKLDKVVSTGRFGLGFNATYVRACVHAAGEGCRSIGGPSVEQKGGQNMGGAVWLD